VRRVMVAVATAAAAAIVLAGAPNAVASQRQAPGGPGIGDPYFADYGNGGYDVSHYDLRLRYWPDTDRLQGTATILAQSTADLSRFNLDFVLDVASVRVNNRPATFAREGDHELVVTPAREIRAGQQMTIVVQYSGVPSTVKASGLTAWRRTAGGALAVGEPEIAWWWFPSNDHPQDKATFDISVLAPTGVEVLSNGAMPRSPREQLPGWTRWSWRSAKPMATYLAFLAIGQYEIRNDTTANGQPLITAYADDLGEFAESARASVERTAEIVDWEASRFGPYPFEAQGGVVVPPGTIGFALENQTRPVYSPELFRRGSDPYLVVHENAHEWFGDSVSVYNWKDIWLNEGFATYAMWLWSEHSGEGTAQELFDFAYNSVPRESPFWQVNVADPGPSQVFSGAVYQRGAMALHQMRLALGDDAFFRVLREWLAAHQYGNGTVAQFQEFAEQIAGKDLDPLFTAWLHTAGRPTLGSAAAPAAEAVAADKAVTEPRSWAKINGAEVLQHAARAATPAR
jgi:aminopeptidase N